MKIPRRRERRVPRPTTAASVSMRFTCPVAWPGGRSSRHLRSVRTSRSCSRISQPVRRYIVSLILPAPFRAAIPLSTPRRRLASAGNPPALPSHQPRTRLVAHPRGALRSLRSLRALLRRPPLPPLPPKFEAPISGLGFRVSTIGDSTPHPRLHRSAQLSQTCATRTKRSRGYAACFTCQHAWMDRPFAGLVLLPRGSRLQLG